MFHDSLEQNVADSDKLFDENRENWHKEMMVIEQNIVDTWIKLKQVILENDHFNKKVLQVEANIDLVVKRTANGQLEQAELVQEVKKDLINLNEQFEEFFKAQAELRNRDQVDLDRYLVISELTGDRLDCVTKVLEGLNGNLDSLQEFLDILSKKKPESS